MILKLMIPSRLVPPRRVTLRHSDKPYTIVDRARFSRYVFTRAGRFPTPFSSRTPPLSLSGPRTSKDQEGSSIVFTRAGARKGFLIFSLALPPFRPSGPPSPTTDLCEFQRRRIRYGHPSLDHPMFHSPAAPSFFFVNGVIR